MNEQIAFLGKLYANNLFHLSPQNIQEEKEKFFSAHKQGKHYNPLFTYPLFPEELTCFKTILAHLHVQDACKTVYQRHKKKTHALINMYEALQKNKDISQKDTEVFYGFPTQSAVKVARQQLEKKIIRRPKVALPFEQVKKRMLEELRPFEWKLKTAMMPTKAKVVIAKQTLYLNPKRIFSQKDVKRLIVHEIHAHVQRAHNHQHWTFPCKELLDSTPIEEGLAYYLEESQGVHSVHQARVYAARLLGVYYNKKSFYELFCMFKAYQFSDEKAFTLATRVKRGVHSTARPGGLTKDHTYLSGKLSVEHYIKQGGNVATLLKGRFGLHELPLVNKFI